MFWILLCLLFMKPFPNSCQDCLWSSIVNIDGKNSPGSAGTFIVNSTKALSDGIFLTWRLNSIGIVQHIYSTATSSFSTSSTDSSRYTSSIETVSTDVVTTELVIKDLKRNEDGLAVDITRSSCPGTSDTSVAINLVIKDCDKTFYQPSAANTTSTSCDFGCTEQFNCTDCLSGSFQGVCQTDTSWSPALPQCSPKNCSASTLNCMNFTDGASNAECGKRVEVQCDGGLALCGGTNGTCTATGDITLENTTLNCCAVCAVTDFDHVALSSDPDPRCGRYATFQCLQNSTCETVPPNFSLQCGRNGVWLDDHPCIKICPRLKDAWIAFIVLMPLWLVEFIVLIFLTRQPEDNKSVHWISCSVDALKKCYAWKYWTTFRLLGAIPGSVVHIIGVILIGVSASSECCCILVTLGVAGVVVSCGGQVYILVFIFGALCIVPVNKVVPEAVELNANQTPDA